jgi:hypothetical protein
MLLTAGKNIYTGQPLFRIRPYFLGLLGNPLPFPVPENA